MNIEELKTEALRLKKKAGERIAKHGLHSVAFYDIEGLLTEAMHAYARAVAQEAEQEAIRGGSPEWEAENAYAKAFSSAFNEIERASHDS